METTTEVTIVGAGPVGVELAVGLKRAGIPYVHLEAGQVGATMAWWAPGTRWFSSPERISIAGVPLVTAGQEKATREEYLAYLRGVVMQFGLAVRTYEAVDRVEKSGEGFVLTTRRRGQERLVRTRKLILATGGTALPRMLEIPGEDLPHVSHYFHDPHVYFQQRTLIVGGGNSAVEAALRCHRAGARVSLSYRGAGLDSRSIKYWLYPEIESLLKSGRVAGHMGTRPVAITPTHATLRGQDGSTADVPADFVLLMVGYVADMRLFEMAGVRLEPPGMVPSFDPGTMETNVPGLFVAGTAIGGTQENYRVFLENCHVHAGRIVAALTGQPAPAETRAFIRPES